MSLTGKQLESARIKAENARAQLTDTMVELQARLRPSALLDEAVDEVRARVAQGARDVFDVAKARPMATAGIVALIVAWLFRRHLLKSLTGLFEKVDETAKARKTLNPEPDGAALTRQNGESE